MDQTGDKHRVLAKRSLGQHFLTSDIVPRFMCDAATLAVGDTVLEIGPGTGVLTAELLARGAVVIAIETDARSISVLHDRFATAVAAGQLHIYEADLRAGLPANLPLTPHQFSVVANIPYYLTGYLFRLLLETERQPRELVFLVQKEIATRIARDQKGSLLALSVRAFGTPEYIRTISPGHFNPPPRVQSAILAVRNIGYHHVALEDTGHFFAILHAGFAHKRKYLRSNLTVYWPTAVVDSAFTALGLPGTVRAEEVALADWASLVRSLPRLPQDSAE